MNKKEAVWREVLVSVFKKGQTRFVQKKITDKYGVSTSTVFNALKPLRNQGAVRVDGRGFNVVDTHKILYIWATHRNIEKDVVYRTRSEKGVQETEGLLPSGVILTTFSAYRERYFERDYKGTSCFP